ncbi:putative elongator complex protein 1 [Elasticomyces elasticus]|nr:putative elongator complex protein 1 [Elasticomyces elasticus]
MRNLRSIRNDALPIENISAIAYDLDDIVFSLGPTSDNPTITLKRLHGASPELTDAETITSWDVDPSDEVLDLHCFPDIRTISLVLAAGDIVTVRQEPLAGEDQIEIVGSVDAGIAAIAWSPDEELVAIVTKADTVLLMTRDFEPTASIALSPDDVKVSSHVSVGWGKKETQFKGRGAAKALRDPTMPEHVDEGSLSAMDDGKASLTWRGDGQYFAMNSILDANPRRRVVRVYTREGVLESVSEPVNGLETGLSWKPSGQIIAGVQRTGEGLQIVFFERNGLSHGEFDLRLSKDEAETIGCNIRLSWNTDSSVLAVTLADRVQLWTTGNYHWYLKQELRLGDNGHPHMAWHPERPLKAIISNRRQLRVLEYEFAVARGSVILPNDQGLVAVIDGKRLLMTPLRIANVPPPMAFDVVELPESANGVSLDQNGTEITVTHCTGGITRWSFDYSTKPVKRASLLERAESGEIACKDQSLLESPALGNISLSSNGILTVTGAQDLRIPGVTSYIITPLHLIYTTSNHLLKFVHLGEASTLDIPLDEPEKDERCRNVERGAKIVTVMPSAYSLVLQMPRGNLETIYPRALVLAGVRQSINDRDYKKAFLICRAHRVDMNILHDHAPEQFMRDVALFLKQVKKVEYVDLFLSSLSDEDVAQTMYKETLNLGPEQVLLNGHGGLSESLPVVGNKINRVCDAFLRELRLRSGSLQNIITAHVCRSPADLEAGLQLVSDLRKQQKQDELEAAVDHICFLADVNQLYETALGLYDLDVTLLVAQQSQKDPREYLPYLQGLHDLQPLRQKHAIDNDLKRYRKALSHLHAMDEFEELKTYMKKHELYSPAIDMYRYDNARLSELMRLFADSLSSRNRYKESGIAYEYVNDYKSASEAYRAAGSWQESLATAALVPVTDDELFGLATEIADGLEEVKDYPAAATIYVDYLDDLQGAVKLLCKGYQFAEATRLVALRRKPELLLSVIDPGLIEASAAMTEMLSEMRSQLKAQIPRLQELRLKKEQDPLAFVDGADGGDVDIPDNLSIAPTDASTTGTFMTRYTNRSDGTLATDATRKTHKNRRREERKRARGKKGTVYEEEYLVNSIARLVERLNAVSEDVSRLTEGLMRRSMRERALAVDSAMQEVTEICRGSLEEVFVVAGVPQTDGDDQGRRPWGGQGVLWESLVTAEARRDAPVMKTVERLSLLV